MKVRRYVVCLSMVAAVLIALYFAGYYYYGFDSGVYKFAMSWSRLQIGMTQKEVDALLPASRFPRVTFSYKGAKNVILVLQLLEQREYYDEEIKWLPDEISSLQPLKGFRHDMVGIIVLDSDRKVEGFSFNNEGEQIVSFHTDKDLGEFLSIIDEKHAGDGALESVTFVVSSLPGSTKDGFRRDRTDGRFRYVYQAKYAPFVSVNVIGESGKTLWQPTEKDGQRWNAAP